MKALFIWKLMYDNVNTSLECWGVHIEHQDVSVNILVNTKNISVN